MKRKALDMRCELDNAGDWLEEAITRNLLGTERGEVIALLTKMLKKD